MLKWQFQPTQRSPSWRASIREGRYRIARLIQVSPSLASYPGVCLDEAYVEARAHATDETGIANLPHQCPWPMNKRSTPSSGHQTPHTDGAKQPGLASQFRAGAFHNDRRTVRTSIKIRNVGHRLFADGCPEFQLNLASRRFHPSVFSSALARQPIRTIGVKDPTLSIMLQPIASSTTKPARRSPKLWQAAATITATATMLGALVTLCARQRFETAVSSAKPASDHRRAINRPGALAIPASTRSSPNPSPQTATLHLRRRTEASGKLDLSNHRLLLPSASGVEFDLALHLESNHSIKIHRRRLASMTPTRLALLNVLGQ